MTGCFAFPYGFLALASYSRLFHVRVFQGGQWQSYCRTEQHHLQESPQSRCVVSIICLTRLWLAVHELMSYSPWSDKRHLRDFAIFATKSICETFETASIACGLPLPYPTKWSDCFCSSPYCDKIIIIVKHRWFVLSDQRQCGASGAWCRKRSEDSAPLINEFCCFRPGSLLVMFVPTTAMHMLGDDLETYYKGRKSEAHFVGTVV